MKIDAHNIATLQSVEYIDISIALHYFVMFRVCIFYVYVNIMIKTLSSREFLFVVL
jgi:hypothetical protein